MRLNPSVAICFDIASNPQTMVAVHSTAKNKNKKQTNKKDNNKNKNKKQTNKQTKRQKKKKKTRRFATS